eukprot:scaffold32133_cov140-Isochrysis_galbana.AAC.3
MPAPLVFHHTHTPCAYDRSQEATQQPNPYAQTHDHRICNMVESTFHRELLRHHLMHIWSMAMSKHFTVSTPHSLLFTPRTRGARPRPVSWAPADRCCCLPSFEATLWWGRADIRRLCRPGGR